MRHLHQFAREVWLTEEEFDTAINKVTRLGRLTSPSQNNGTGKPTSANLLGPFWRQGSPTMANGASIVRSPTEGPPLFFTGRIGSFTQQTTATDTAVNRPRG
ncbi:dioxygenase [Streptomyces griseorubiginosus]|uniref:dioxygenase n=1 Tax=Streptomyces griseorubiginosus TaxID=67304 RepID=UPI001AD75256|nr:dioxygenase [Streptomyces griseorubiginosus]MBO4258224.1 hypothetical protein [Streptomyces griseorubiginosus]